MNVARVRLEFGCLLLGVIMLAGAAPTRVLADVKHARAAMGARDANTLIDVVRQSTQRFKDVKAAIDDGYALQFGCVSGGESCAMGMHYVNMSLVADGELDPTRPEIVIYEPTPDGSLKLIGADYLVLADSWNGNPKHTAPPQIMGQLLHY